jgi:hypothetical protein
MAVIHLMRARMPAAEEKALRQGACGVPAMGFTQWRPHQPDRKQSLVGFFGRINKSRSSNSLRPQGRRNLTRWEAQGTRSEMA